MNGSIRDYYSSVLPEKMHFAFIPELSDEGYRHYHMLSEY